MEVDNILAFASIETDAGRMTLYFNGNGNAITASTDSRSIVEQLSFIPKTFSEAVNYVKGYYSSEEWDLRWIS